MIKSKKLISFLKKNGISFFCGVPDSILKSFSLEIQNEKNHFITSNEGTAISFGAGYHLATKKLPCIFMQNSGLGNSINPLTSLNHKNVYSLPCLLLIGWRGAPNVKDEPQHKVKGSITTNLLKLMGIRYYVLKKNDNFRNIKNLISYGKLNNLPVACLIKDGILEKNTRKKNFTKNRVGINRREFIFNLLKKIKKKTYVISTTGYTSREHFEVAEEIKNKHVKNFYMVGAMGHTNSLSLGFSLNTKKDVICIDGDGSFLMHMGSMLLTSLNKKKNFKYILLNNDIHESVGSQKTNVSKINFKYFFKSMGINEYLHISKKTDLSKINDVLKKKKSFFVEVKTLENKTNILKRPQNLLKIKKKFY